MYVTMNHFKIKPEYAEEYVKIWQDAQVRVEDVDGFLTFKFFRLDDKKTVEEGYVLFASYSEWESKEKFEAWKTSDHFKKSHSTGPKNRHMYIEHPHLKCFDVLM
ncbi:MAG: antibiotic biosynthesis monooxygenase [Gammaproteobacteria bacterium]|nr:MAG: antibiotic biosynthesis monooxygenase [Gammaproteobacteria bacterium]